MREETTTEQEGKPSPMRLSTAIRLGAMLKPQSRFGSGPLDTCALSAALEAIGVEGAPYARVIKHFPLTCVCVAKPISGELMLLISAVRELNDFNGWSREAIADWVETVEASLSGLDAPTTVAAVLGSTVAPELTTREKVLS